MLDKTEMGDLTVSSQFQVLTFYQNFLAFEVRDAAYT